MKPRVPTAQRKQGKGRNKFHVTHRIWEFCQKTGKTQGILFDLVVNSLMLNVKDIEIFAVKMSNVSGAGYVCQVNIVYVIPVVKIQLPQGKFMVGQGRKQGNTGNLKIQFAWGPWKSLTFTLLSWLWGYQVAYHSLI